MRSTTIIKPVLIPSLALAFALSACADAPTIPDQTVVPSFDATTEPPPNPHPPGNQGCTPGFWKNHLDLWVGVSPGDDFDATFGVDLFNPDITLGQAIRLGGGGVKKLARHGTAALVSALKPGVAYPLTAAQVIAAVQAGDSETLAGFNELGCPIG